MAAPFAPAIEPEARPSSGDVATGTANVRRAGSRNPARNRRCEADGRGARDPAAIGEDLAAAALRLSGRDQRADAPAALPGLDGPAGSALSALGRLLAAAGASLPPAAPEALRNWLAPDGRLGPHEADLAVAREAFGSPAPEEVFARAYEQLVRPTSRRLLGTYFTPPPVVEFMIERLAAALPEPQVVVDAGAGVGALTLAATRRWPGAWVHAVDVNPGSLGLLAVAAQATDPTAASRLTLTVGDYLSWSARWGALPEPRALLANPPYTRHQARTDAEKKAAAGAAGDLVPHRTASLSSYMLAATWRRLAPDDALCLVLPDNWLHAAYGAGLRHAVWQRRDRRIDLYAMPEHQAVFPDARIRAMVLLAWPARTSPQPVSVHSTRLVSGRLVPTRKAHRLARGGADDPLRGLWRQGIVADGAGDAVKGRGRAARRRPLSDFVLLRRGIATGSNKTFLLRTADTAGVPPERLRRAVHRLAQVTGPTLTAAGHARLAAEGHRCWLLDVPDEKHAGPAETALLAAASAAGVPAGVLCRRRSVWHALEFPAAPPSLIVSPSAAAAGRFRVVRNDGGAYITNNLLGAHARAGAALQDEQWMALAEWLASDDAQDQWHRLARFHSGGLRKLEPRAARSVLVPGALADEMDGRP
jgi:predicted RNA methylase